MSRRPSERRALIAWCLYDWANSPFPTVVVTFVFAAYFTKGIVGDDILGAALWSQALGASGLVVALVAPVVGAVADAGGRTKPWLLAFSAVTALAGVLLWFAGPDPANAWWVLGLVALGNVAFEMATVFYNAMLPRVAGPDRLGRVSGWGWALGYAGGVACLALALVALIDADPAPFGLDPARAEPVRAVGPLVALWLVLFGWPLFAFVAEPGPGVPVGFARAARDGIARLARTVREVRRYRDVAWFLVAKMLYIDGLNTIFALGGVYAATVFAMAIDEILLFGIALNVTAALGAFGFAWIDDRVGPKRALVLGNLGLIATAAFILLARDATWFWVGGLALGVFIGPVQASSRSLMARLAPAGMAAEMFGLYAFSGKATAFLGPILVGWVTLATGSPRLGMATVLPFLISGLALLALVRPPGVTASPPRPGPR
ncbi:MAG: MFS transporter [Alphaproteobacteria bacterium]